MYLLILFSGIFITCRTVTTEGTDFTIKPTKAYSTYKYNNISFSYTPLTDNDLIERHGNDSRYFIDSAGLFPPRIPCVIAFKITVPESGKAEVLYEEAFLTDGKALLLSSCTREEYYDLWKEKTIPSLYSKVNWVIDHSIHKKNIILSPGSTREGYFIFLFDRPRLGDYTLSLPVKIDDEQGTLMLPLTLDLDELPPESENLSDEPVFIPDNN